jgi:hypothetical protein
MTSEQGPGATWIGRDRLRNVVLTLQLWVLGCCLVLPVRWPVLVLQDKHPPVTVFVYLAVVAVALLWSVYRAWRRGCVLTVMGSWSGITSGPTGPAGLR